MISSRSVLYKFIRIIIRIGKVSSATKLLFNCFIHIRKKGLCPISVVSKAITLVSPPYSVPRVGRSTCTMKMNTLNQSRSIAIKWIVKEALSSKGCFSTNLSKELINASSRKGKAFLKKVTTLNLAADNNRVL